MRSAYDFMRLCLQKKEIPLSWGISNIVISRDKVTFDVNASKYQGVITITEREDNISVKLSDKMKTFSSGKELMQWLDETIE